MYWLNQHANLQLQNQQNYKNATLITRYIYIKKVKGKFHPITWSEGIEGE
jgi:hypothetical protein